MRSIHFLGRRANGLLTPGWQLRTTPPYAATPDQTTDTHLRTLSDMSPHRHIFLHQLFQVSGSDPAFGSDLLSAFSLLQSDNSYTNPSTQLKFPHLLTRRRRQDRLARTRQTFPSKSCSHDSPGQELAFRTPYQTGPIQPRRCAFDIYLYSPCIPIDAVLLNPLTLATLASVSHPSSPSESPPSILPRAPRAHTGVRLRPTATSRPGLARTSVVRVSLCCHRHLCVSDDPINAFATLCDAAQTRTLSPQIRRDKCKRWSS